MFTKSKKFLAHDEGEVARVGDFVEVKLSRKLSRRKAFVLNKIIKRENYLMDEPNAPPPEVVHLPPWEKVPSRSRKIARLQKIAMRKQRRKDRIEVRNWYESIKCKS